MISTFKEELDLYMKAVKSHWRLFATKAEREALCAYQKMYIAHVKANSDLWKVKHFAKSILKEEMYGEAW